MDIYVWISVLSVMYSWISSTVLSAPAGDALTASTVKEGRHVRTKRCSCASFQDKECVYFCHLDIIWVNTPERVVSYGLGNAPRTRRALADSSAPRSVPRCQCVRENDNTCLNFCRPENRLRCASHSQSIFTDSDTKRRSHDKRAPPPALRAALKTRLFLEKWRVRQHHRARAWEGESVAS
uniref:Endothelin-1 n=1 Tax=Maylandia zebra TaxID=106582 RepID=A0A3P9DLU4_9CICH